MPVRQHDSHGNSTLKQRASAAQVVVGGNVEPSRLGSLKVMHCVGTGVGKGVEGKYDGVGDGMCVGRLDGTNDGVLVGFGLG